MTKRPDVQPSIQQDGRLDMNKLDVTERPRRRRRKRERPDPSPALREWEKGADVRALARPRPPGVVLMPGGMDKEDWIAPHSDDDLWSLQLADAFGTRSHAVIVTFMSQLQALCGRDFWDEEARQWRLDENEFSAAIALVNSIKPRNEMEAALAAQMVGIHLLSMKVTASAIRNSYDTKTVAVAGKLARTFAMQMAELRASRMRKTTARQSIKVRKELHQHVHYHDDRGASDNGRQPHGRAARALDQRSALPSPEPGGDALPLPGAKGQKPMQTARRKIDRRT